MNPTWEDPIHDDEDDENAYDRGFSSGRDAVIFLIDATGAMFEAAQDDDSPFQLSLKCARTTLTNKIISSNKDLTGIVFFGTDKTKNSRNNTDFKHIYIFSDLCEPGAEKVIETEELMNLDPQTFRCSYGHSSDFSLADALWVCSIMFSNCKFALAHRRILLFTSTDNPHEGNSQLQLQAKTKAKDLHESNIDIDLMHIQKPNKAFDPSVFYKDIALTAEDEHYKLPDASDKFDDLLTRVRCKEHRKRPLGSLELSIGKGVKAAFKMYKLVVPTPKPYPVKLAKENNAELVTMTNTFLGMNSKATFKKKEPCLQTNPCAIKPKPTNQPCLQTRAQDTGEVLLPSDLKKFQEYGNKKIYVTDDEAKQIRRFAEPGLVLMGFKPKSLLKPQYHMKPSFFLYPDEKSIEGSIRMSFAFIIQCQKRDYVPICRLIARQNDPPRIVALLPQEEQVDERGVQLVPPGFHVIYLPYMEDIRNLPTDNKHHPTEELVEKSKEIIKKLQFAYHPESFENPVLQKHWRNIEALALNREAPEEIVDYTLPTKDVIEKRAGKLIDEFKALLCPSSSTPSKIGGNSCGMTGEVYGSAPKRQRLEDIVVPVSLQLEADNGQLARFRVNVLKEFCRVNGIRSGSKKADLVEAIKSYYDQLRT